MQKNNYTIKNIIIFQINSKKIWLWTLRKLVLKKKIEEKIIKFGGNERNMEILPKNAIVDILLITMDMLKMLMEK
jgi:predicted aspartyl protease